MIRLGVNRVSLYPNNGIKFVNHGGHIVFKGNCCIGNDSVITVGNRATLSFGENFNATASLKIVAYNRISFGHHNLIGWNCLFMDTDFHRLTNNTGELTKGIGRIEIGDNNWFACNCVVTKNTITPRFCTISIGSHIFGDLSRMGEKLVIGIKKNVEILNRDYYLDLYNNKTW